MTNLQELCKAEIEALIDKYGLRAVASSLKTVCYDKAEHIESYWQDRALARRWRNAAKACHVLWSKVPLRGALMTDKGTFRIRKIKNEYVVEELRWGSWMVIEGHHYLEDVDEAYAQYCFDGHTINWA